MVRLQSILALAIAMASVLAAPKSVSAADYVVYSVYQALDMGDGVTPQKDFYVNMGSAQGVGQGTILQVYRRISTYDLVSEKLYRDVTFPIATLKVIHAESNAAIARLDKFLPEDKTPAITPRAVMIGDIVRIGE